MIATYLQNGLAIDYVPATDIEAGDVIVLGTHIGIAKLDIPANTLGTLATTGVFEVPKDSGAISAGISVYWDPEDQCVTATSSATTVPFGVAIADASASATVARVLLRW